MKTNFYVDGFNLYNRAVKDTPYKWLDLSKLFQRLTPHDNVNRIRYFTALIEPRGDPQRPARQQAYLRALRTIPNLSIHLGMFRHRRKTRPLANPSPGLPSFVEVLDTEEKGTDVNIATYLLMDGYEHDYEKAVVVSNDSDLALPISIVKDRLKLLVGVVNPNIDPKNFMPVELSRAATFVRQLREPALKASQFPPSLSDAQGRITKPAGW